MNFISEKQCTHLSLFLYTCYLKVWYWIQAKMGQLSDEGSIDKVRFLTTCNAVTLSRDKANDLMSCIDRYQPPPYVFICGLIIDINLFFHSIATGIKWAIWMKGAGGFSVWLEPRMYVEVISLVLYTTVYAMLFDICTLLHNPFGPRGMDIEHYKVGSGIRNLAKQLQKADHPNTMEASWVDDSFLDDIEDVTNESNLEKSERKMATLGARQSSLQRGSLLRKGFGSIRNLSNK